MKIDPISIYIQTDAIIAEVSDNIGIPKPSIDSILNFVLAQLAYGMTTPAATNEFTGDAERGNILLGGVVLMAVDKLSKHFRNRRQTYEAD